MTYSVGTISKNQSRISAAPLKSLYSQKQAISTYLGVPYLKNGFATEEYVLLTHIINTNLIFFNKIIYKKFKTQMLL